MTREEERRDHSHSALGLTNTYRLMYSSDENESVFAMGFLNAIFANPGYGDVYWVVPILVPTLN